MSSPAGAASGAQGGDAAQQGEGQGQGQQQQGEGQPGGQPVDVGALAGQLAEMQTSQEEMRQYLQSQFQQPQGEGDGQGEGEGEPEVDLSFMDPSDPGYDPDQMAQQLHGLIDQTASQRAQQMIAPVQAQVEEMRRENEMANLVAEFPEMNQPEVANDVVRVAGELATAHGKPDLAQEPWFWRMAYMAARAAEHANSEGTASPEAAHLEGGAGASPAAAQQVDLAKQIADASTGGGAVLPFQ